MNGKKVAMDLFEAVLNQLREKDERITIQRRLVIESLCNHANHMTINDVRQYIEENHKGNSLSETTIYRILQWLKGLRLVSQTDMGSAGIVYELIKDPPHHHLICLKCNHIIEVNNELFSQLYEKLRNEYDFEARIDHMAIYGHCRFCEEQLAKQKATS